MNHLEMQENIESCEAQIAASGAVLGMMDDAMQHSATITTPEEAREAAVRALVREHVVGPLMKMVAGSGLFADGGAVAPGVFTISGDPIEEFMPLSAVGSLPSAAEMKPAIRSVVQSIAADLICLPVREMSPETMQFTRVQLNTADAAYLESQTLSSVQPAPAGLTKVATDGEKNGRLGWMPGAR
jgi:hypothetical protein